MSEEALPSVDQALRSLCQNGDQFAKVPLAPVPLGPGLTYLDRKRGRRLPLAADDRVLAACGMLYVDDSSLRQALQSRGANVGLMQEARRLIDFVLRPPESNSRLVWGISGYATIGHNCSVEAQGVERFYAFMRENAARWPDFVSDGGSCSGVLGLSGVLAKRYWVRTLGFTPLQGIASMAPRDSMIIGGETYQDREVHVGLMPDALVCFGGRDGAMREAIATAKVGGVVVLIGLNEDKFPSFISSWEQESALAKAAQDKRLFVCKSLEAMPTVLGAALAAAARTAPATRPRRIAKLRELLA